MNKYKIKISNKIIDFNPNAILTNELITELQKEYPFQHLELKNLVKEEWKTYNLKYWKKLVPKIKSSQYSYIESIKVSNLGRIKIQDNRTSEEKIIPQENDPNYPDGYLRLKGYASLGHVYRIVARAFILGNNDDEPKDKNGKAYPIHHIDNNGYNNCIENLIYVSPEEHAKIHKIIN